MKFLIPIILLSFSFIINAQNNNLELEPEQVSYGNSDWLIDGSKYGAGVFRNENDGAIVLTNGLLRRTFRISNNAATVAFDNLITGETIIRGVKPEAEVKINGIAYEVGGLKGQKNYAYLKQEWIDELTNDPASFQFVNYQVSKPIAPFEWKRVRHHDSNLEWPPKGVHLRMDYKMPEPKNMIYTNKPLPSNFGRTLLQKSSFNELETEWKTVTSEFHSRSSFENEGKTGEIYTPENTSVYVERALPEDVKLVEMTLDVGTDKSKGWGPGIALVGEDKIIKFYLRPGGNNYDDGKAMFGLWDGEKEIKAAGGRQVLDLNQPWKLRLRFDKKYIYCEAKSISGDWQTVESIINNTSTFNYVRIGKMGPTGNDEDKKNDVGKLVRLHIFDYAAYSDYDLNSFNNENKTNADITASVHYELYDGIPVIAKWITIHNNSEEEITINSFTNEILAAVEYISPVEHRGPQIPTPNIHVETDYAFSGMTSLNANNHVVNWEIDPEYSTQVNYLRLTPCLLKVKPEVGPEQKVEPGNIFKSFRTFVLPYDSYDRERKGLSQRRMYRILAPWTTENPLMMHARFADWEKVKVAIDQSAEVGFEMVILTFGSGFNIEDDSYEYLAKMKKYSDYAKSKGIEIGGYSLLASRKIGGGNDVEMPEGKKPTFGNSPCLLSEWGKDYFRKLYQFYERTGFALLEHDGSYPGDVCIAKNHPGHNGYSDSRWNQFSVISTFYKWCRSKGIYLNVPDYYYVTGSNKCGMGYREVNWSLPREQQLIHTRQNIYDGTWTKSPSMGWMFVPLTQYHGGGSAATIEPLNEHLDHYKNMMISNLGGGVQACYRGPRLFDTLETKRMVKEQVDWYKTHREVLEGDIIHLRRPDGRDLDYWLNVNPNGKEKGMLVVYNPLNIDVKKNITIPLYYTGLTDKVVVISEHGDNENISLSRDYSINLEVNVNAGGFTWFVFE